MNPGRPRGVASERVADEATRAAARPSEAEVADSRGTNQGPAEPPTADVETLGGGEGDEGARERLFNEVLASVELVLAADGAALWREEPDHSLVLTASRSIPDSVLDALDRYVTTPLQSIMERWPNSPLVAVPLDDPANPLPEEMRAVCTAEGIAGLAGVPAKIPGETLGLLIVVHRQAHSWTVRDLRLATGFAGQLATALQNARLFQSVRALAGRLAAIHELSLRLNQLRDVDAIGEAIVAEVGRLVDCDTVRVYRLDARQGLFRPVAVSGTFVGVEGNPLEALARGLGETLPTWVAKRNEPLIIADASLERRAILRSTLGPESMLLVPMAFGGEVQGVLVASREGVNRYGPDDEQALSIFARYAAQAIVNADNIEQLERQRALLERQVAGERRLLEVNEQLVSTLEPRLVLEQIAETLGSVVRYDRLTIYRVDRPSGGIEAVLRRAGPGELADASDAERPTVDEGLTSWVIGRGDPVCANDVEDAGLPGSDATQDRSRTRASGGSRKQRGRERRRLQNIIVVPLRVHGEVVGSLNLSRVGGAEAHFNEHEFELSKLFASQASIALQNAETHLTVATRADLDALTGLRNHGTFERDLASLVEAGDPFALLMMDLDSFKAFNDTYGHPAGDALLRTVGRAIVAATRQNDRAYRYGGDEFALLLIGAAGDHTEEVAERIRKTVREFAAGPNGPEVSVCVGAARWPDEGPGEGDLVRAADQALYRAKGLRTEGENPDGARPADPSSSLLFEAAREILGAATPAAVAAIALRQTASTAGATDGFAALAGPDGRIGRPVGIGAFERHPPRIAVGKGFWGGVWETGRILVGEPNSSNETPFGLPLRAGDRVVGLIGLTIPEGVSLAPHRLLALGRLADLAGAAAGRFGAEPAPTGDRPGAGEGYRHARRRSAGP